MKDADGMSKGHQVEELLESGSGLLPGSGLISF